MSRSAAATVCGSDILLFPHAPLRIGEWNELKAHTDRQIALFRAALRIERRPSGRVLKEANGANAPVATEIEPVPGSSGHPDQVACLHLDRHHRAGMPLPERIFPGVDMEEAMALDDEAHLVLVVPVFFAESGEHHVQVRGLRLDVDHVGRHVAPISLEGLDLIGVGPENLLLSRFARERIRRCPSLIADGEARQKGAYRLGVFDPPILLRYPYDCHSDLLQGPVPLSLPITGEGFILKLPLLPELGE